MNNLQTLIDQVSEARRQFIAVAKDASADQAIFKPSEDSWCIVDIVEHMVWAEQGGINGMWKALEGIRSNKPVWTGEFIHKGLPIEKIIELTWREREKVPESAKPRWGGPLAYWIVALNGCQVSLQALGSALAYSDCENVIYPHIMSGPLNVIQRMEFLRFHLNRHQRQIEKIKSLPDFPKD
jgi:DinB superfamily